jgi:excisionase family DNA binding protein
VNGRGICFEGTVTDHHQHGESAGIRQLHNLEGAGKRLGDVSPSTVRRLILAGKLRGIRVGKQWRVDDREIEAFIQRGGCSR